MLLGLGAVGDRTDELIDALGELGGRGADVVAIAHKAQYLRGRTTDELDGCCAPVPARVGVTTSRRTPPRSRPCRHWSRARPATSSG